jgi:hypothetical protein
MTQTSPRRQLHTCHDPPAGTVFRRVSAGLFNAAKVWPVADNSFAETSGLMVFQCGLPAIRAPHDDDHDRSLRELGETLWMLRSFSTRRKKMRAEHADGPMRRSRHTPRQLIQTSATCVFGGSNSKWTPA